MVDQILNFEFTGLMGLLLYWLPLSVCAIGYTLRTWKNMKNDIKARAAYEAWKAAEPPASDTTWSIWRQMGLIYRPTDTVGTLIGRGLASIIPVCNLLCAACDILPKALSRFFERISAIFDQPLVPKK